MRKRDDAPRPGVKGFQMSVLPSREALDAAIADNGQCEPKKCWHRMEIYAQLEQWAPHERHEVRVDAGHVKLNYCGYRYIADSPLHLKRSLMLFDVGRYEEVRVRRYNLRFRRTTKIIAHTRARKDQINEARRKAYADGRPRKKYHNLRERVAGFSGVV